MEVDKDRNVDDGAELKVGVGVGWRFGSQGTGLSAEGPARVPDRADF